ncbi:MAG: exodeoxyribonuclease VII small subunit [Deltaproteobacteria bacterium]|nr:exodeoxyribonuclease VII small subunit [Deltaproteobacteria bacterium]MBW2217903.1 exodeoxyribonuclease VII small subunit [Deltaproteobacteria bacterium]
MSKKTFEESMKQLEQIVDELESGNLPLEKALKKFEEGVKLSKACNKKLDEIEQKVTILIKDNDGNVQEKLLNPQDVDDNS